MSPSVFLVPYHVLFKNLCVVAIGLLTYAGVGFSLMYPGAEFAGEVFGFAGFGLNPPPDGETASYADGAYTHWTDFLFQGMFAATAATIVSGAVAERVRLESFLFFSTLFVALIASDVAFVDQLIGVAAIAGLSFPSAWLLMKAIDRRLGMRVGEDEERRGLDLEEHGVVAYHNGGIG